MRNSFAVSTNPESVHAALQVLKSPPSTAVDAVIAGFLAAAVCNPSVLLGAGVLMVTGRGEGLHIFDGRALQPGIGSARIRGFLPQDSIPDAARVAVPTLPAALIMAHMGRGEHTLSALVNMAIASAKTDHAVDSTCVQTLRDFGRLGGEFLRSGAVHQALLECTARSLGGVLTSFDLESIRPRETEPSFVKMSGYNWAFPSWNIFLRTALTESPSSLSPVVHSQSPRFRHQPIAIVAAADPHGAMAIAGFLSPTMSIPVGTTGLQIPLLAKPTLRGRKHRVAGQPLPLNAAIAAAFSEPSSTKTGQAVMIVGVGGFADSNSTLTQWIQQDSQIPQLAQTRYDSERALVAIVNRSTFSSNES